MLFTNEIVPVVFFDGEQETSLGNVVVSSSLNFSIFQSMLCEKIGISPHQFTIYLSDRARGTGSRIPVTGKFNFSAVSRHPDCFFLVVLKRSRRTRRRPGREVSGWGSGRIESGNVMILRRGSNEYENERYLADMGIGLGSGESEGGVCEECVRGGSEGGFHWCVRDTVTVGFKSPAGPIARPVKHSG